MTYQIGMVASDGILLASDMRCLETDLPGVPATSSYREKIVVVENKGLGYCCAGDDCALALGTQISEAITEERCNDPAAFFRDCYGRIIEGDDPRRLFGGSVLVALIRPALQLWQVSVARPLSKGTACQIKRKFVVAQGGTLQITPRFIWNNTSPSFQNQTSALFYGWRPMSS